jgi:hypothetical protein
MPGRTGPLPFIPGIAARSLEGCQTPRFCAKSKHPMTCFRRGGFIRLSAGRRPLKKLRRSLGQCTGYSALLAASPGPRQRSVQNLYHVSHRRYSTVTLKFAVRVPVSPAPVALNVN